MDRFVASLLNQKFIHADNDLILLYHKNPI